MRALQRDVRYRVHHVTTHRGSLPDGMHPPSITSPFLAASNISGLGYPSMYGTSLGTPTQCCGRTSIGTREITYKGNQSSSGIAPALAHKPTSIKVHESVRRQLGVQGVGARTANRNGQTATTSTATRDRRMVTTKCGDTRHLTVDLSAARAAVWAWHFIFHACAPARC